MVKLVFSNFISSLLFQLRITVSCAIAQLLFDADKLVVLSHTVGTAHRTCLNLTRVCCYGNISNCCILGFTRSVRLTLYMFFQFCCYLHHKDNSSIS